MRPTTLLFSAAFSVSAIHAQQWGDPSFGTDGVVNTPLDAAYDGAYAMALQPNGKLVTTGPVGTPGDLQVLVARYGADGTLDMGFGSNGVSTFDISADDYTYAIALQGDGKILVAGTSKTASNTDILVLRLDDVGHPDPDFATDGVLVLDESPGATDKANAIAVRPDGRILLVGTTMADGKDRMLFAQFNADGTPDPDFGIGGIVMCAIGADNCQANALVLLDDGRFVVAGSSFTDDATKYDLAVGRFLADGSPDLSFSDDGKAVIPVSAENDKGLALAVQGDGSVLVGGVRNETSSSQATIILVRLDATGTVDASFGSGGTTALFTGGYPSRGEDIAVQADGRILICGTASPSSIERDAYLCRLNSDGTRDEDFGDDGELRYGAPNLYRETPTMVLQPDGKPVIGGIDAANGAVNTLLLRFFPDLPTGIQATPSEVITFITSDERGITFSTPSAFNATSAAIIDASGRTLCTWAGPDLSRSPCTLVFDHRLGAGVHMLVLRNAAGQQIARSMVPGMAQ